MKYILLFYLLFWQTSINFSQSYKYGNVVPIGKNCNLAFVQWNNISTEDLLLMFLEKDYLNFNKQFLIDKELYQASSIEDLTKHEKDALVDFCKNLNQSRRVLAIPIKDNLSNIYYLLLTVKKRSYSDYIDYLLNQRQEKTVYYSHPPLDSLLARNEKSDFKFNKNEVKKEGILVVKSVMGNKSVASFYKLRK